MPENASYGACEKHKMSTIVFGLNRVQNGVELRPMGELHSEKVPGDIQLTAVDLFTLR